MKVPWSWLVELVPGLEKVELKDFSHRMTMAGLEFEGVEHIGSGVTGPVVAAKVLEIEELTEFKKPIRFVTVDAGAGPRGIVCGARNFAVGDVVAAALPGAVLPGDFSIAARTTYGRVSDGMICSVRELGIGDDHDGIWILPPDTVIGSDMIELVSDVVVDIAITPDRGYCLSLRGLAREAATAYDLPFTDPADVDVPPSSVSGGYPVVIEDQTACSRYVARTVTGLDQKAVTPLALQRRLSQAGMRSISVAVDVTNLVLLGLGQPLHAFDADKLSGPVVVRRAHPGEKLVTLDGTTRTLHPEDLVITDDSGPVALAGVMGGLATEITETTTRVLVESAWFDPVVIARTVVRHGLASEASRRFERGVDDALAPRAAEIALRMLTELAGATPEAAGTDVDVRVPRPALSLPLSATGRKAGRDYDAATVRRRLLDVGCEVSGEDPLQVVPPSWRRDLTAEAELTEEVIRLEGYDTLPSVPPRAIPGKGLTTDQRRRRQVGRALAAAGFVEAVIPPWLSQTLLDRLGLPDGDDRLATTRVANPLSDDQSLLRTTLLPGLLTTLARNEGRGLRDIGLFEVGPVVRPGPDPLPAAPRLGVASRPSDAELDELEAALPHQPRRVAVVAAGQRPAAGWTNFAEQVGWTDAVEAAQTVARTLGLALQVTSDQHAPWHPGRCAALQVVSPNGDVILVGHAGELHPRVCAEFDVPPRTVAMELDLDLLAAAAPIELAVAPVVSPFPPMGRDIALVVGAEVPAARIEAALVEGAGPLLESLRLFDRYDGAQVGDGNVSLAYRLSFRAKDRTLTDEEANAARDAAVARAAELTGAVGRA